MTVSLPAALEPTEQPSSFDRWLDLCLGVGAGLLSFVYGASIENRVVAGIAAALMALPLVFRRRSPLLMLAGVVIGGLAEVAVFAYPFPNVVVVPIAVYSVARWAQLRWARTAAFIGVIAAVMGPLRWTSYYDGAPDPSSFMAMVITCLVIVLVPYVWGRRRADAAYAVRQAEESRERALRQELAESEQRARFAEINERNRIARELHDIVAHSLSVIVVQAEGGRALAAKRPEQAVATLDTISEIGREALGDIRRIVGVLRNGADAAPADFAPASGLADIAELVARTSERARFEQRGEIPAASQTLGMTAYRLVQEALTNVLKHAGPDARAEVLLDCTHPEQVRVQVSDDGHGASALTDGMGNGIQGMFERVQMLGGTLIAQPRIGGGFLVRAVLPLHTRMSFGEVDPSATRIVPTRKER